MSLPALSSLPAAQRDALACSLALLVLSEGSGSSSAADIVKVAQAAKVSSADRAAAAFEKGLKGRATKDLLVVGGGGSSGSSAAPAASTQAAAPAKAKEGRQFA